MGFHGERVVEVTLHCRPEELGIVIPPYAPLPDHLPFALYTRSGSLIYLSGHIPDMEDKVEIRGRLGEEIDLETGREAARRVALNLLSTLQHATGALDRVGQIIKLTGFVACAPSFTRQPDVINAASEVFCGLWGEAGTHARSAIGVAQLPLGVPVEIELIAELENSP